MECLLKECSLRNRVDSSSRWTLDTLQKMTIIERYSWFENIINKNIILSPKNSVIFRSLAYDYECRVERLSEYCSKRQGDCLNCDI